MSSTTLKSPQGVALEIMTELRSDPTLATPQRTEQIIAEAIEEDRRKVLDLARLTFGKIGKIHNDIAKLQEELAKAPALKMPDAGDGLTTVYIPQPVPITEHTSDGYHTFKELYEHRNILFVNLCLADPKNSSWKRSSDPDWILLFWESPEGQLSYHLKSSFLEFIWGVLPEVTDKIWDGHESKDVFRRLKNLATWRGWIAKGAPKDA